MGTALYAISPAVSEHSKPLLSFTYLTRSNLLSPVGRTMAGLAPNPECGISDVEKSLKSADKELFSRKLVFARRDLGTILLEEQFILVQLLNTERV